MIYGELVHSLHADHLVELRHEDRPYTCDACLQIGFGARYTCAEPDSRCNFHLHKDCAVPKDTIVHPFYPGRIFVFLVSPDTADNSVRWCDACAENIEGYNYHCFDANLDLHPSCASLDRTLTINEGRSMLRLGEKMKSKCHKCGNKRRADGKKSWGYSLSSGECCFHVACVKEMLTESWEKEYFFGCRREGEASDEKAIVAVGEPRLQISIDDERGKRLARGWGKLAKWKKIVKIALTFVMAAIVGDPTALVIGLFSQILTR